MIFVYLLYQLQRHRPLGYCAHNTLTVWRLEKISSELKSWAPNQKLKHIEWVVGRGGGWMLEEIDRFPLKLFCITEQYWKLSSPSISFRLPSLKMAEQMLAPPFYFWKQKTERKRNCLFKACSLTCRIFNWWNSLLWNIGQSLTYLNLPRGWGLIAQRQRSRFLPCIPEF